MAYYDLDKTEREKVVYQIHAELKTGFEKKQDKAIVSYFDDEDTYIRKNAYQSTGKLYDTFLDLRKSILNSLVALLKHKSFRVRQTAINAAGEIGKKDFPLVQGIFDTGLFDEHHSPRNAVIGSIKKMGQVNPKPVMAWAKTYLKHPDKEIRREICHGIELRGRTHPQDILPLLQELEFDTTARVKNTLVHVLGQIAYKKGCLETVVKHLQKWKNKELVTEALEEIIDVHLRYRNFAAMSQESAEKYIHENYVP